MVMQYLFGAIMYAAASGCANELTPEQLKGRIEKMDRSFDTAIAILAGTVAGGLITLMLAINTPETENYNHNLETKVQQVQVYDAGNKFPILNTEPTQRQQH